MAALHFLHEEGAVRNVNVKKLTAFWENMIAQVRYPSLILMVLGIYLHLRNKHIIQILHVWTME